MKCWRIRLAIDLTSIRPVKAAITVQDVVPANNDRRFQKDFEATAIRLRNGYQ